MTEPESAERVVAGRYRLEQRIGAGAMGVVWRAVDQRLGRTVAVKELVIPPSLDPLAAEQAKQRLMREGRIAAKLHHPNAIGVFDVADHDGTPWLVMEYLPGRSLATELDERGPLPPLEVASIGQQLASALAAAHAAGIVHRDVKPGNVLIGLDGSAGAVKLTDFGISRAVDDVTVTQTGVIAGTPAYLAPEVARGTEPAAPADVFALGATLYAAVEGEPPFGLNENPIALLHQVAGGVVRPPRQAGPLTATLMQLLRADPAARPTMAQVRGLLARCADGKPRAAAAPVPPAAATIVQAPLTTPAQVTPVARTRVGVPPVPPRPPAAQDRERRRRRVVTAAAGAVLAVLATVLALAATRGGSPGDGLADTGQTSSVATEPAESVAASSTTSLTPTSVSSPPTADRPTVKQLRRMVTKYYELLPDKLDQGWTQIGPDLRSQANGYRSYREFWQRFKSVRGEVVDADPASMQVRVIVNYREDDRRFAEEHLLTLVQRDGQLLINSDQFVRTVTSTDDDDDSNSGERDGD